jgi:hypothetical protein
MTKTAVESVGPWVVSVRGRCYLDAYGDALVIELEMPDGLVRHAFDLGPGRAPSGPEIAARFEASIRDGTARGELAWKSAGPALVDALQRWYNGRVGRG